MQVGKQVVCVDDAFPKWVYQLYVELPVKGVTYTVRLVRLGRTELAVFKGGKIVNSGASERSATVAILLEELRNPDDPTHVNEGVELAFNAERFRELEETEETEHLVEAEPAKVFA